MKKIISFALSVALTLNVFGAVAGAEESVAGQTATLYADYVKSDIMPENMITVDATCSDWNAYSNGKASRLGWNFNFTATTEGAYNSVSYKLTADTRYNAEPTLYKVGPIGKTLSHMSGGLEGGKNYIISAWAKDISVEGVEPLEFGVAVKDTNNNQIEGEIVTLSKNWEQYAQIFSMPANYPGLKYLEFGVPTVHQNLSGQGFMLDDLRVEEEIPFDISVTAEKTDVEQRGTLNFSAEMLNQLGIKGKINQNFKWYVVNQDRTEKITSGFEFSANSSETTLTVGKDVPLGKYIVMAESTLDSKFKKGIEIEVKREVLGDNGTIVVESDKPEKEKFNALDKFTLTAKNVSVGDLTWYALKENRQDFEDKIIVTPVANSLKADVEFADDIEDGTYYVIAEQKSNDSIRKGFKVVVDNKTAIDSIIVNFNSGSFTEWESDLDRYMTLLGEDDEIYKKADKAEILKLIVEQQKVEKFTKENINKLLKGIIILSLYNKNTENVILNNENGDFNFETELGLTEIGGIYKLYKNQTTKEGKEKVLANLVGKNIKSVKEFKEILAEKAFYVAIAYPSVYGVQYLKDVLTMENLTALGIDEGKYFDTDLRSGYHKEIARKELTKSQLEAILAKDIKGEPEDEEYEKPSGEDTEFEFPADFNPEEDEGVKTFSDVPENHWAYADIYFLTDIGAISGVGADSFAPDQLVTREAAAKIITKAFNLQLKGEAKSFSDVDENAWYAESIKIAASNGVVNGISDDKFGVGMPVTRQDLCVMIVRALNTDMAELDAVTFEDKDQISEYAIKAVSYLNMLSVVSGYNDNTFRPQGYCKRAEIAKMVSKVINIMENESGDGAIEYSKAEELLFGLGAVDAEKYSKNTKVLRAELAEFIYDICIRKEYDLDEEWKNNTQNDPTPRPMREKFSDVDESHEQYLEIYEVVGKGYMDGISTTIFAPDIQVNLIYVVKTALDIMGYEKIAQSFGGTDEAYFELANSLGMLDGVYGDMKSPADYKDVVKVFANVLEIGVNKIAAINGKTVVLKSDSEKTFMTEVLKIDYVEGIMTENGITSLSGKNTVSRDEIKVAGIKIKVPEKLNHFKDYIGKNVRVYYDCSVDGVKTLVFLSEHNLNPTYQFNLDDFTSLKDNKLTYEVDGRDKTISINENVQVILNGVLKDSFDENIFKTQNGDVTVLTVYEKNDYIIVNSYKDFYVTKISAESEKLYNSTNYKTNTELTMLNLKKGDVYEEVYIYDELGARASFADIPLNSVLAVKADDVNKIISVIIYSEGYQNVKLTSQNDDEIIIVEDGETPKEFTFKIGDSLRNSTINLEVGEKYNLYVNKFGYVVNAEKIEVREGKQIGILTRTVDNEDEEFYGARLYGENKTLTLYTFAKKVTVNGDIKKNTDVNSIISSSIGEPVVFVVTDGVITEITTPASYNDNTDRGWYKIIEPIDDDGNPVLVAKPDSMTDDEWLTYRTKNWYVYTDAGEGSTFGGKFSYDSSKTDVFTIPADTAEYGNEKKFALNGTKFTSYTFQMVDAYAYDKNAIIPDVIVTKTAAKQISNINIRNCFVITGIAQGLSDDDEPKTIFSGYKISNSGIKFQELSVADDAFLIGQEEDSAEIDPADKSVVYLTSNTYRNATVNNTVGNVGPRTIDEISVGDIIRYDLDSDGEIKIIAMNFDKEIDAPGNANDGYSQTFEPRSLTAGATFGYVMKSDNEQIKVLEKYTKTLDQEKDDIILVKGARPENTNFNEYDAYQRSYGFPAKGDYDILFVEMSKAGKGKCNSWVGTLDDIISFEDSQSGCDEIVVLTTYKGGKMGAVVYR